MTATTTFPPTLTVESVRQLFNPASIVLVGATDKSSWSRAFYANLVQSGFAGAVHLVNPRGGIVHDQQSYRSVADLPEPADLAIVMVPTGAVLDVMGEIADAGIRSAVVLTAGFGEVGEEGARLEEQLRALARERGIEALVVTSDATIQDTVFGGGVDRMSANDFSWEMNNLLVENELDATPRVSRKNTVADRIDPAVRAKLEKLRDAAQQ